MILFRDRIAAFKPLVFATCLLPLALLAWDAWHGALGADPVAQLEHRSGDWGRLLLATLAITPLRSHRLEQAIRSGACSACSRSSTSACI